VCQKQRGAARIYFVNALAQPIPMPAGVTCTDTTAGVPVPAVMDNFFITWFSNFVVEENGNVILLLDNQKSQALRADPSTQTATIEP
jgi:hypothetical protein